MFPTSSVLSVISQPFKRAQLGLFQGKTKQAGNNVPFSKKKTRRTWLPNVQNKQLASDILGKTVELKVTVRALRSIKKSGGIDKYLLKSRADIIGWEGMRIRNEILQKLRDEKLEVEWARRLENSTVDFSSLYGPEHRVKLNKLASKDGADRKSLADRTATLVKPTLEHAEFTRKVLANAVGSDYPLPGSETVHLLRKYSPLTAGLKTQSIEPVS